ncbi:MAG: hypothetical protein OEM52_09780 [bacterium]|nr:hypothetical protein [bacterium]
MNNTIRTLHAVALTGNASIGDFIRLSFLLLLSVMFVSLSYAERYAGEFLLGVESPRARAMGGVGAWIPDGGFAVARNPADLAAISTPVVDLHHSDRFTGIVRSDYAGVAMPSHKGGIGIALYRLGVERIPYTKLLDPSQPHSGANRVVLDRYVSDQEWALWIGAGRKLTERWSLGAAIKPIWKQLGGGNGIGVGVDVGSRYSYHTSGSLAFAVTDLVTSPIRWNTERTETIKPRIQAGFAHQFTFPRVHADVLFSGGMEVRIDQGGENLISGHGGLEYCIEKVVALRAGYDKDQIVFGGGIKLSGFGVDYAYRNEPLGSVHLIGCHFELPSHRMD